MLDPGDSDSWSSGENETICLSATTGRPDEGPRGADHPIFSIELYLPECVLGVCRDLNSVRKQTQTLFTLRPSEYFCGLCVEINL